MIAATTSRSGSSSGNYSQSMTMTTTLSTHSLLISTYFKKNSNSDISKKSVSIDPSNMSSSSHVSNVSSGYTALPSLTTIDLYKDFGIQVSSRKYNGRTDRSVYVKKVSCGEGFTFILLSDNRVFSRGANRYGQLGLGHRNNISATEDGFHHVTAIPDTILDIQGGADFTLFFKTKSSDIYGCGSNSFGKLGIGLKDNSTVIVPKRVKSAAFNFRKIESIACGLHHVIYITEDREVVVCGCNFK
ncbi:hypothetical protein FDP41_010998 [Naegleria fowleri]|uniref:Uncharacterized protein n=1 Tax=Naegleria fowleri TaxID=5763 RepID=A0A6A5CBJ4_NAEFO|nr:uncharacterized protein FDP41_010998 [Naegleria fowleri]KAF0983020.1 hypothetical protein FDP41_010998 [Naegleria fowleri]